MSDREKSDDSQTRDQRIAYVQMMSNTYRIGLSLDVAKHRIGLNRQKYEGKGKNQKFSSWEKIADINTGERFKRAVAVLEAIGGLADFAKQARNAASLSPDIFIASIHSRYSHRTLRALECDDKKVNTETLKVILEDFTRRGRDLIFWLHPKCRRKW